MAVDSKLHIALFPWLAFGHMIPYLELAKLIAQKGHKISYISTPRNIDRLPELPPNLSSFINFVKIPLPRSDDLPQDAEATTDVPFNKVQYLKKSYDRLKEPLTVFLENSDIDWILYDFAAYWLPDLANSLGISHAFFGIFLGATMGVIVKPASLTDDRTKPEQFTVPPKWVNFPTKVAYKLFEILRIFESVEGDASGVSDLSRAAEVLKGCEIIAIRSCIEFEPEWLNLLEEIHGKPCIPVGMLPTTGYENGKETNEWRKIKQWLDKQDKASVVYVAFGSEGKPSQLELNEIALGLELSGLPFFWVLRKRRGSTDAEVIELPDGFEERTKGRGVVSTGWAPQLKILAHDSIGGFLTHSGWSSVVEASQYERPLILLTFLADQGINARILEEKKMGYSVPRNEFDGSFTSESVAES
ncbi:UDP-glucosyltransferase, putative [Ricinus communis]|uniref:UDP-glucosyltransferase, putative n=2 Tax=Ricinus communis TaxID=3988 RepID=B9T5J8_RICCO|nr:UDP-glucosyltransferase, putative [Ricinus communis]|eukprot:XP_002533517.1 UDP-glycosyltransferase 91A1 [Ricinus communis]